MDDTYVTSVSERYIELYESILGEKFYKADISNIHERIGQNVSEYLKSLFWKRCFRLLSFFIFSMLEFSAKFIQTSPEWIQN